MQHIGEEIKYASSFPLSAFQRFPLVNFIDCVVRTLLGATRHSDSSSWIRAWYKGPISDPSLITKIGDRLYRSIEQRSPVLQSLSSDIMTQHWPLTPIVKSVLKGARVEHVFTDEDVTRRLCVPVEILMFRLTVGDWDTLLAYCLETDPNPICEKVLLFRTNQSLFDFVCDHSYTPDTVLEPALSQLHRLNLGDDPRYRNVMQRLEFLVEHAKKQAMWTKIRDIGSLLLLPTVEIVQLVDPVIDWDTIKLQLPDEKERQAYMKTPVVTRLAWRLSQSQSDSSKKTSGILYDLILSKDFATKMDIVDSDPDSM